MFDIIKTNNGGVNTAKSNEPRPWWLFNKLKSVDNKALERQLFVDTFIYPDAQQTFYNKQWIDRGLRQNWALDKLRRITRLTQTTTPKNWSYRIGGYPFETYQVSANLIYLGDDDVLGLVVEYDDNGDSSSTSTNHNFLAVVYTPADIMPASVGGEAILIYKVQNGNFSLLYQWDSGLWGGIVKNTPYRMTVTRTPDRLIINFRGLEFFYLLTSVPGLNEGYRNGKCGVICNSQTAAYCDFVQEAYSKEPSVYSGMINIVDALRYQFNQSFNNEWFIAHVQNLLRIHTDYKYLVCEDFFQLNSTDQVNSTADMGSGVATNGIWYSQNYDLTENIRDIKIIPTTYKNEGCIFDTTEYAVAIDFNEVDDPSLYAWQTITDLDLDVVVTQGSLVKFRVNIPNNVNLENFIALMGKNTINGVF